MMSSNILKNFETIVEKWYTCILICYQTHEHKIKRLEIRKSKDFINSKKYSNILLYFINLKTISM